MSTKKRIAELIIKLNRRRLIPLSDRMYVTIAYRYYFDKKLNLKNPQTFNEKLQWLKLNDRKNIYTTMVDKYEVKKYVASIIGEEYIIPTLGVYNKFDEINFDELPNQFVIKCTHDSGGLVIVKDKNNLNLENTRKKINDSLSRNYYYHGREWPYKNVQPKIIIEKFISNNGIEIEDYKVHNFNGIPKIVLVCRDRYKNTNLTEDFFDVQWNHLDIKRPCYDNCHIEIEKPKELEKILQLSKKNFEEYTFCEN